MYTNQQYSHKTADKYTGPVTRYQAPVIDWQHDETDTLYWKFWAVDFKVQLSKIPTVTTEQYNAFIADLPANPYQACKALAAAIACEEVRRLSDDNEYPTVDGIQNADWEGSDPFQWFEDMSY